jgi:hypothetical protein
MGGDFPQSQPPVSAGGGEQGSILGKAKNVYFPSVRRPGGNALGLDRFAQADRAIRESKGRAAAVGRKDGELKPLEVESRPLTQLAHGGGIPEAQVASPAGHSNVAAAPGQDCEEEVIGKSVE